MKLFIFLLLLAVAGNAQTVIAGPVSTTGPITGMRGLTSALPATCSVGQEYFADDAAPGRNKYFCTATNTWTQQAATGSVTLDAITAAGGANTPINNSDFAQIWKWTLTTASKTGFRLSENTASAATGTPILIGIDTLAASTVYPFQVTAGGTANGVRVDTTGKLSRVGTGQVNADHYNGNAAVAVADGGTGLTTAWARPYQFFAAGCNNATAFAGFDLPASGAPAANCLTGSNTQQGTLDFDDAANETAQFNFILPSGWTGNIDADLYWLVTAGGSTNAAKWTVATSCEATAASYNGAFNAAQTITTNVGSNNNLTQSTQSAITTTGCSAGNEMHVKIGRDTTDTSTATIRLKTVVLTLRITPQA